MNGVDLLRVPGQVTLSFDGTRGNALNHVRYAAVRSAAEESRPGEILMIRADGAHFCTGQDLAELQEMAAEGRVEEALRHGADAVRALLRCRGTVVVAAHGGAIGVGALLVAAADVAVLADDTWLQLPELRLGLPLGFAVAKRLLPAPVVRHMMLTDEVVHADRLRTVATVVPRDELGERTEMAIAAARAIDPDVRDAARALWGDNERERTARAFEREVEATVRLLRR